MRTTPQASCDENLNYNLPQFPFRLTEPTSVNKPKTRHLGAFWKENGSALLLAKICTAAFHRMRDHFLASKIGCAPFKLGRTPKILGLGHIAIGRNFSAGESLWLEAVVEHGGFFYNPSIVIGDNVGVSDFVHIGATIGIDIGDGVLIGSRVLITDHNHGVYRGDGQTPPHVPPNLRGLSAGVKVSIGQNVWIGDGVAILPGTRIGAGSIIGANSVVTGEIPPNCIAFGIPAKPVRRYDPETAQWAGVTNL